MSNFKQCVHCSRYFDKAKDSEATNKLCGLCVKKGLSNFVSKIMKERANEQP